MMAVALTPIRTLGVSLLLYLVALPLISLGVTTGSDPLWGLGLGLLALAGAIPLVSRLVR